MEETEVPLEQVQEEMNHHAAHSGVSWISWVALSSALLAGMAAVSALLSGHHANEAMLEQIKASNQWSYYQAKSIKSSVLSTRAAVLEAMGKPASEKDQEKMAKYEEEQKEISQEAQAEEKSSQAHLSAHQIFARAVTFSQIAIALGAIAVLTKRRSFFFLSLAVGAVGAVFLVQGLMSLH